MSERPILFSGEMVRAILDGRKTQTRRIMKPQPPDWGRLWRGWSLGSEHFFFEFDCDTEGGRRWPAYYERGVCCPFGVPGNLLWVRETYAIETNLGFRESFSPPFSDNRPIRWTVDEDGNEAWEQCHYRATDPAPLLSYDDREDPGVRWSPSIHMPRWASRITLRITDVRAERLTEISAEDAKAEGLKAITKDGKLVKFGIPDSDGLPGTDDFGWPWDEWCVDPRDAFRTIWESIHGKNSWTQNPWVWVVSFECQTTEVTP